VSLKGRSGGTWEKILLFVKYYQGDESKDGMMGGPCSTHEKDGKCIKKCCSENRKGRDHLENLDVDIKKTLQ
jgi:hypothetical protein